MAYASKGLKPVPKTKATITTPVASLPENKFRGARELTDSFTSLFVQETARGILTCHVIQTRLHKELSEAARSARPKMAEDRVLDAVSKADKKNPIVKAVLREIVQISDYLSVREAAKKALTESR